jgi:hypothetical protein
MDSAVIIQDIGSNLNSQQQKSGSCLHLTIPAILTEFGGHESYYRNLVKRFLAYALESSHTKKPIRIAVHEMKPKEDLEQFFSIYPSRWLRMSIESQANTDFAVMAQKILKDLGYGRLEWTEIEGAKSQLGDFRFGTENSPVLILFIQNHGAQRNCDFLIPVMN